MMFAEPEDIEPDLIGKLDLLDQMLDPLGPFHSLAAGRIGVDVCECIKTQFHGRHPVEFSLEIRTPRVKSKQKFWNDSFEKIDSRNTPSA
jgi:hypothetical protein